MEHGKRRLDQHGFMSGNGTKPLQAVAPRPGPKPAGQPGAEAGSSNHGEKQQQHCYTRRTEGGMEDGPELSSPPSFSLRKPDAKAEPTAKNDSRLRSCLLAPGAALAPVLASLHPRLRPWHVFAVLGAAAVLVAVLAPTLVHVRDMRVRATLVRAQVQAPSNQSTARVNLGYAQYQGTVLRNGVSQYLGMRFAKEPTGDLRWRAPQEPDLVKGDQAADTFGKICLGISVSLPSSFEGEDCLFANVWAPANATSESKIPVWLFIQGGGYTVNSNANWNGSTVVQESGRNIVFVNFNYRVGLYGFLASERVRKDGDLNVGLLDQRMMIKWIKKHITQFGGDPNHITIQGVSAGAGSVALHLVAYGGRDDGLFQGAIGNSVFFPAQPRVSELEWQFDRLLNETGCSSVSEPMTCLRGRTGTELQAANVPSPFPGRNANPEPLFYWTPCIDGDLLRDYPYKLFESGNFINVPMIFGTDNDEGTYFAPNASTEAEVSNFFQNNYPHLNDTHTSTILAAYPEQSALPLHAAYFPSAAAAYGDTTFICPALQILRSAFAAHNTRAWGYHYNVLDPINAAQGLGVPHTWETWAVFGPDSLNGIGGGPASYYTIDAAIVPVVMDYWISFVRALDPNVLRNAAAPVWEPTFAGAGGTQRRLLFEEGNVTMEDVDDTLQTRCDMWRGLAEVMEQ